MAENNGRALIVKFANTPFSITNTTMTTTPPPHLDYYDTNEQSFMTSMHTLPSPSSQTCPYILTSLNTTNPWSNNNITPITTNNNNGCLWTISTFKQQQHSQPLNGWCISVRNLPLETSEHILWEFFGLYGQVQHVHVTSKETWCQGSVVMTSCDDAAKAIRALNGFIYGGRVLQVSFF
jgi:hypothetical protein